MKLRQAGCVPLFHQEMYALTNPVQTGDIRCINVHNVTWTITKTGFQAIIVCVVIGKTGIDPNCVITTQQYSPLVVNVTLQIDDPVNSQEPGYTLPNFTSPSTISSASDKLRSTSFENADELRAYWRQVHGINLPAQFGGYVNVRFRPDVDALVYPACCIVSEYYLKGEKCKFDSTEPRIKDEFTDIARKMFGESSVERSMTNDENCEPAKKKQKKA